MEEVLPRAFAAVREALAEVPIETRYYPVSAARHLRPFVDSVRVYAPLIRFTLSSILAFVVDLVMVLALQATTGSLLFSVIAARLVSCSTASRVRANFRVSTSQIYAMSVSGRS